MRHRHRLKKFDDPVSNSLKSNKRAGVSLYLQLYQIRGMHRFTLQTYLHYNVLRYDTLLG